MKREIMPFREFWIDCYSTIIYSIYCSLYSDKLMVYRSKYFYKIIEGGVDQTTNFFTVIIKQDISILKKILFHNEIAFECRKNRDVKQMIQNLNNGNIVLLGVDLYYWIEDGVHWHKNHIQHHALIKSYNKEKKQFIVLDTGKNGYLEYSISLKQLKCAAFHCTGSSKIFYLNEELVVNDIVITDIVSDICSIISSIDMILEEFDMLWNINDTDSRGILYFADFVQTHIYSFECRQRANALFCQELMIQKKVFLLEDAYTQFRKLEDDYNKFKMEFLLSKERQEIQNNIVEYKSMLHKLLSIEKNIWKSSLKIIKKYNENKEKNALRGVDNIN